jgi:hypothetical protein
MTLSQVGEVTARRLWRLRHNTGLPEFGIIIVQVGNSRLGCADPESSDRVWIPGSLASSRPGMTPHTFYGAEPSCGIAVTSPQLSLYMTLLRR